MKTHILSVKIHDDFISISDQIEGAKAPRVLLVWPDHGKKRLLLSDLVLVLRKAEAVGAQLALVSDDVDIIEKCRQINLAVFDSIPAAEKHAWRRPRKTRRLMFQKIEKGHGKPNKLSELEIERKQLKWQIPAWINWTVFAVAIMAVIAILAVFMPSATLTIQPKTIDENLWVKIWSSSDINQVNLSGAVPMKLAPVVVEASLINPSTGIVRIPTQYAEGEVTFRNLTGQRIEIPAGTVVRTVEDALVRFATSSTAYLPAGVDEEVDVVIRAIDPGVSGNVQAGEIQAIEGEIGGNVVVSNALATNGGVDSKVTAPSEVDYDTTKAALIEKLEMAAMEKFALENEDVFFSDPSLVEIDEILSEVMNPQLGVPADQFQLTIEARFNVRYISDFDIEMLAAQTMDANLPAGYIAEQDSLFYLPSADFELDENGQVSGEILISQTMQERPTENEIIGLVTGKTVDEAYANLSGLTDNVMIKVFPGFWQRLPYLSFRIHVEVQDAEF